MFTLFISVLRAVSSLHIAEIAIVGLFVGNVGHAIMRGRIL